MLLMPAGQCEPCAAVHSQQLQLVSVCHHSEQQASLHACLFVQGLERMFVELRAELQAAVTGSTKAMAEQPSNQGSLSSDHGSSQGGRINSNAY